MVKDVENVQAKLDVEGLRNSRDLGVLDKRKVEIRQSRASENVATHIAKRNEMRAVHCNHGRNHKALKLDVIIDVPRINRIVAPGSRNAVGIGERIGIVQPEWIPSK